jgi:hypothetical protein
MPKVVTRNLVLSETKTQLKMNQSMLEMLKGNTPLEDLARLRDVWVTPLEELVRELENERPMSQPPGCKQPIPEK